jgi:hypothetical protein
MLSDFRYTEKKAKSKKKKKNKQKDDESPKSKNNIKEKAVTGTTSLEKVKNAAFDRLRDDAASSSGTCQ